MEIEYIPIFCDCGGIISGKIGTRLGFCPDCKSEYEIARRIRNE